MEMAANKLVLLSAKPRAEPPARPLPTSLLRIVRATTLCVGEKDTAVIICRA